MAANLKGEVVRTLTEDLKNPDVLYLGTETGLFVSLDRGKSWQRLKANLPTVRIDEITLHPRDNAMILATHGRAIWILDHLEPIQEYAAAQTTAADAKLFVPSATAMFRRPASDRNYEFWGDQTFFGENPPQAAVISWYLKNQVESVPLKITDAAGNDVREISGPVLANSNRAGHPVGVLGPARAAGTGAGVRGAWRCGRRRAGRRSGRAARRARRRAGAEPVRRWLRRCGRWWPWRVRRCRRRQSRPVRPRRDLHRLARRRRQDRRHQAAHASLSDPEVALTEVERKKMFDMAMEMHELQRRSTEVATGMGALNTRLPELAKEAGSKTDLPADLKTSVETLQKDVAALAPKLTLPAGGGRGFGGGGGGGRGGGGADSLVARVAQAKTGLMGGMPPNEITMRAYTEAKTQLPKAIADANSLFARAATLSSALTKYSLTLTAPTPVK